MQIILYILHDYPVFSLKKMMKLHFDNIYKTLRKITIEKEHENCILTNERNIVSYIQKTLKEE